MVALSWWRAGQGRWGFDKPLSRAPWLVWREKGDVSLSPCIVDLVYEDKAAHDETKR